MILNILNFIINYKCEIANDTGFSWETLIALSSFIIAIIALVITSRYQVLSFVNSQLLEVAKTCNAYLQDDFQVSDKTGKISQGRASGIVTALEDAEKIINGNYSSSRLIFKKDKKNFRQLFFIHLHSSIKEVLKAVYKDNFDFVYIDPDKYDPIRKDQLDKACAFFYDDIKAIIEFGDNREKRLKIN